MTAHPSTPSPSAGRSETTTLLMCDGCGAGPTPYLTAGLLHHCGGTWRDAHAVMATFLPETPAVSSYRAPNDDDLPF